MAAIHYVRENLVTFIKKINHQALSLRPSCFAKGICLRIIPNRRMLIPLAFALSMIATWKASAMDVVWTGGTPDWNSSPNWNGGAGPVPGSADRGIFNLAGPTIIEFSGDANVRGLQFNAGALPYTFNIGTSPAISRQFTLNGTGANPGISNLSASLQTFNVNGGGALTFAGASAAGATTRINVNDTSTVFFSGTATAQNSTSVVLTGTGRLDISGLTTPGLLIGSVSATTAGTTILLGTKTLNIGTSNTSDTIAGGISGSGILAKGGTGTLTLSGTNTYTGQTLIEGGTLAGSPPTNTLLNIVAGTTYDLNGADRTIGALFGGGQVLLGASTLTVGASNTGTTYVGILSGIGGQLVKQGTAGLTLVGNNSYTGGTTITGGTLSVQTSNTALGTGTLTFNGAGTTLRAATTGLNLANAITLTSAGTVNTNGLNLTLSGLIGGAGLLTKSGAGTLTLGGAVANTYTGGTAITGGTVAVQTNNAALGTGTFTFASAGTTLRAASAGLNLSNPISLSVAGSTGTVDTNGNNLTLSGLISGPGRLIKGGAGTLTITTLPTYTGTTTITGGTLAGPLPTNTSLTVNAGGTYDLNGANRTIGVLVGAGAVNLGANILTTGGTNASSNFSGVLSGVGGGLTKGGTGNFVLSGANTYSGLTTISAGALTFTGNTALLGGNIVNNAALVFNQAANSSFGGNISGTGTLQKAGVGTLTLSGAHTYTGTTLITQGTLAGSVSPTASLSISGGATTYDLNGANRTVGSLTGAAGAVHLGASTLTTGGTNASTTFSGVISGIGGGLTKVGTGVFTLTGANTYSGLTTISAGTLIFTGNTALLGGNIVNNASLIFNQAANSSFGGGISGTGSLTKTGLGTLTLTGPNTYTGGTTITGGVLAVNNDGNLGGAAGGLTFAGGTLRTLENAFSSARPILINTTGTIDTNGVNATLSGPIGGVGGLIKLGGGNLTLTGNNTYGGGTTISEGSLTVTTTSIQGNVSNNGALVFNQAIAGTFAGDMSGAGSLTKMNGGNLTLTGTNTYTGGTTITGGTLTGNSVSLTGNIINNTALAFDQTFAGTFAGDISGPGSLLKEGAGMLFLTGNLSGLTGPVTINNGELEITTTNIPQHYALGANGVLGFAPPTGQSVTFGGTITGAGRVDIDGAGTVSFPSTYTYSGQTTVNNGIFSLDGSLPNSPLFVMPGGTLVGNGSALSGNIGGLISPGHSIGQLTFVNSFTMAPTATYKAEIGAGGASDLIAVGTVASLDGTLNVVSVDPRRHLKGQTYIILTANQRTGAFANLTSDNRIKYTIEYLPNAVRIITGNLQDLTHAFASTDGSNAAIMGRYLDSFDDSIPLGSDLDSVLRVLDTYLGNEDVAGLTAALDQLQPSLFKEFGFLSFNHNALLNKALHFQQQHLRDTARFAAESRRLEKVEPKRLNAFYKLLGDNSFRALSSRSNFASQNIFAKGAQKQRGIGLNFAMNNQGIENRPSGMPINQRIKSGNTTMWIQSYGQLDDKGANSHGNVGIKSRTGGVTLGADYQVMNNTFVGLLGGYSTTFFDWKQARGNGTMNSGYGGVYGSWMDKCGLYVEGQFIAGNDHIKSTRNIAFSTINRAAKESHNAFQFSTNAEVGYVVPVEPFTLQPFYNATYMAVHERGYQEHGADSLNLQVNSKTGQFYRGELGTMIYKLCMAGDVLMRPSLQVGWVQKRPVGSSRAQMSGGLVNQPQTLAVLGDNRVRNQFSAGASLSAQFKEGFYIVGNVSGEVGSGEQSGEAVLSVGYQF